MFAGSVTARTLNWAMVTTEDSHYGAAAKAFKSKLEEVSGGKFDVAIKANGVLGGEREIIEGMQIGSIEVGITASGPVGGFVPDTYVMDLPFLFHDYATARRVMAGPIGQELLSKLDDVGVKGLAWGENGFRYITNSKHPIKEPKDLDGMKIRTMENDIHLAAFKSAGASPTPMSWPEVIPALQQGTIDGQENPLSILVSNRIWEVQKYLTLTGHFYSPAVIMMSKTVWDGLSDEEKGWVGQATEAAVAANHAFVDRDEANGIELLRSNGMDIVAGDALDKDKFTEAMNGAYEFYTKRYGSSALDRVRAAIKN
ncbi:TRAP transporter substrate-binding protein [Castellaniella sp. S9]|uniref:TRAP transporter substrate-binding protein n=1 Tax=Castellaniella sp. S9 TaxID=2993652 RepID=UPI0022B352D2|nr:TRAP transporter substrate-binding protein [Castellaniella sp. S9]